MLSTDINITETT